MIGALRAALVCGATLGMTLGAGTPALAAEPPATMASIGEQIERQAVIRADFVQTKQMAALKRPLVTSGRLIFARQAGVLWQIEKPYRMSYVLGETRLVEIGADGARRVREARDVPGLAQVGRVFRALLGANDAALRDYFDATVQGDAGHWTMTLKPRAPQLAQYLGALQLSGGRYVDEISIIEAGGDHTRIVFSNSRGSDELEAAEAALFTGDASAGTRR